MSSLKEEPVSRRKYAPEQKAQFIQALDRLGSLTAAASELGLNRVTCYQWCRKAGVRNEQAVRMQYAPERKEEFFTVLRRVESVTLAAAELGLNVNTCHRWASEAGIASKAPGSDRREKFLRLREVGMSRSEAITTVGVNPKTARGVGTRDQEVWRATYLSGWPGGRLQTWCDH